MKRVCCFCEKWASGGIESFLNNILIQMDLSQLQVDIVAGSIENSIFTNGLKQHGIQFIELAGSKYNLLEKYRFFRMLLEKRRYDVLHINAFQGLSMAYLRIAKEAGVAVRIAHSHNTMLRSSLTRPLKQILHSFAREWYTKDATQLWACSHKAAEFLFSPDELQRKGYGFIPNGIDTTRFRFDPAVREAIRKKLGLTEMMVVGSVGRFCYQKNQSFLLKVFSELVRKNSESRLLLVGEGEDRSRLEQTAKELGVSEKVIFLGVSDQVEQVLCAVDVFVSTSRFEGLPVTVIEAQAAGLPCVLSKSITTECQILSHISFLELSAGSAAWAETLLDLSTTKIDRANCATAVFDAGFDAAQVAAYVQAYYMGSSILSNC